MKHTPGPWRVSGKKPPQYIVSASGHTIALSHGPAGSWEDVEDEFTANARLLASAPDGVTVLCDLIEWAKGNRGSKHGNPYMTPEIKAALKHLGKLQGMGPAGNDYLDVKTDLKGDS